MKIAISAAGKTLDSQVDPRFGRAAGFIIYDIETGTFEYKDNSQNLNAMQGAGIQSAKNISDSGAGALITGHCGPKAFKVLASAGVQVFNCNAATVNEALHELLAGRLTAAENSDVEGHW